MSENVAFALAVSVLPFDERYPSVASPWIGGGGGGGAAPGAPGAGAPGGAGGAGAGGGFCANAGSAANRSGSARR